MKMTKHDSMKVIFSNRRKTVANSRWFGWFKRSKPPQLLRVSFEDTFSQSSNRVDDVHSETVFDIWLFVQFWNKIFFFCSESNVMSKTTFVCDTDSCMHNPQRWKGGRGAQVDRKMIIDCLPDSCCSTSATMWKSLQASKVAKFRAACPHPYPFSQPYDFTAISLPWLGSPIWNFFLKIDYTPSLKFKTNC